MEFLGDSTSPAAADVIAFVRYVPLVLFASETEPSFREAVDKFASLRKPIVEKLLETLTDIKSGKVFRGSLWIVGEYCTELSGEGFI